jgi:ankyrin repeat protein
MELGIIEAIRDNNLELVRTFPNVNIAHPDNYSALMVACEEADLPIVQDLIARGATINTFNDYGNSPLTLAAFYGRDDIVQELLTHGALIDAMSPNGTWTALMAACHQNRLSTVRLLLDAGADIDIDNIDNKSALYYAHDAGHQEIEQELVIRGAMPLLEPQQLNAGAEDDDEMPALAPGPGLGYFPAPPLVHLMQFGVQPPGPVPGPRTAEILPPEEANNPFAKRFQCSACLTNAVNTRLNPCGHLICSECFVRLNPRRCPICRVEPVNDEPIFYGGNNNFYNKYKKYSTKLKNF